MNNRKTVRIEPELWAAIKAEAVRQDMTIGAFLGLILHTWKGLRGGDKR